jgi:1-deoxy-D-xylulose-5-phosphate synthase
VVTRKGHGYKFAENDPLALHSVTPFDPATGKTLSNRKSSQPTYTQVFGKWLCDMAATDPRLVAITPAMRKALAWSSFSSNIPTVIMTSVSPNSIR